ncbi:MAG: site-2 protease family protein [Gemmataceae bacterium]
MRDRDPVTWSFPLPWRPLGVTVRVHVLFPVVVVGVVLGVATATKLFAPNLWYQACLVFVALFGFVLLHELGHVIAARRLDGDAGEILLWPLGGLTFVDVPRSPRTYAWAALAGPAVNLLFAALFGGALVSLGFVPPFNPLASPLNPKLYSYREGITYFSVSNPGDVEHWKYPDPESPQLTRQADIILDRHADRAPTIRDYAPNTPLIDVTGDKSQWQLVLKDNHSVALQPAQLGRAPWLLAQLFLVNWFLAVVNLLPAFPLDGGRLTQCFFWRKTDYRQATASAAYVGFLMMLLVGVYAIAVNDILPAMVAVMIYVYCRRELYRLEETEEKTSAGSYDFSQGYTSLEREEDEEAPPPPPPPPKLNLLQRWAQRRTERRLERERQQREADECRLDALLEKILREGKQSLNDEELRFLTRMSSRYPNRK